MTPSDQIPEGGEDNVPDQQERRPIYVAPRNAGCVVVWGDQLLILEPGAAPFLVEPAGKLRLLGTDAADAPLEQTQ